MNTYVKRFEKNTVGKDYVVGDIHGCFTLLETRLEEIGFDPEKGDRLFSVGDLVDRGPESMTALDWLEYPWFHAVQGNHEDMAIRFPNGRMDERNYKVNGGEWNIKNSDHMRQVVSDCLKTLPVAMEVETSQGKVGIVHAECPSDEWEYFVKTLESSFTSNNERGRLVDAAQWSRVRIETRDEYPVKDVRAVVVGHTPLNEVVRLGNTIYIDTGGWFRTGKFTVLDLETLEEV